MSAELRPQKVYLGKDTYQVQKIKCQVGTGLAGKYFLFFDSAGAKRYCWFTTGATVDPAPAGITTGHSVTITGSETASEIATLVTAVLTAVSGFDAAASTKYVTLTATDYGYAEPARDGAVASGFTFQVITYGQLKRAVGCIAGDIEFGGLAKNLVPVNCHASGTTKQDDLVSGMGELNLTFALQDTTKADLQKVLHEMGNNDYTPEGADKETVFGFGTEAVGKSIGKLRVELHPVALEAADKSEDTTLWLGAVNMDSLTWSGENALTIPLNMTFYPDSSKPKAIAFGMIGDASLAGY